MEDMAQPRTFHESTELTMCCVSRAFFASRQRWKQLKALTSSEAVKRSPWLCGVSRGGYAVEKSHSSGCIGCVFSLV